MKTNRWAPPGQSRSLMGSMNLLLRFHNEQQAAATIAAHHREVKIDLGVIQWDGKPVIKGYIEKPTYDYCVSMGVYVFAPRVIKYIPRGEYLDFPDLVRILIKSGEKVVGYPFDGYWQDLGRPDDYEHAMQDFEKMRSEFLPDEAIHQLANPAI
jgi:NDP-sugar pyrophosphorylase family protein